MSLIGKSCSWTLQCVMNIVRLLWLRVVSCIRFIELTSNDSFRTLKMIIFYNTTENEKPVKWKAMKLRMCIVKWLSGVSIEAYTYRRTHRQTLWRTHSDRGLSAGLSGGQYLRLNTSDLCGVSRGICIHTIFTKEGTFYPQEDLVLHTVLTKDGRCTPKRI